MGGEEVYILFILNLGIRWGLVDSITPRVALYPPEKENLVSIG
jgi:hypothetical protein